MIYYTINTDNYIENLQAPSWVKVITDVEDLGDPIRNSRQDKILCPFDEPSVYIDASKVHLLNDEFKKISEEIISKGVFTVMEHPHKHSYLEECAEYVSKGWVDPDQVIEMTTEIAETPFDFEKYLSPLCTIIWRPENNHDFNKLWWKWYNKGGVRDQLAFSFALQLSGIEYETVFSRDLLNQFTDADPEGEWWNNRTGDYIYYEEETDIIEFVDLLTEVTELYDWKEYFRTGTDRITGEPFYGDAGIYSYAIEWDDPEADQIIIYTSITNWYDTIPDDNYYDPDFKYVCFTDGKVDKKGPWEFRPIPKFVYDEVDGDPRRLSAFAKICPHKLFPHGSRTVWLDGCYVHTEKFVDTCKNILGRNPYHGMGGWGAQTHMLHPHRFTFHNEVMEGFGANFNTREQFVELVHALDEVNYDFTKYCSPVLTCIWRTVSDEMHEFNDMWWKYSLIGSNRDQVSFDCAKQLCSLEWDTIPDWQSIGLDLTSSKSKEGRNKRHPQAGHFTMRSNYNDILKECYELLKEIRPITGIKDEHQIWQVGANEVKDPSKWIFKEERDDDGNVISVKNEIDWVDEGDWWYDPTTIKTANGKYSIQDKVKILKDLNGFSIANKSSNKVNSFWVRRLKRSLGLLNLPQESNELHVWDWGWSFKEYVTKNVLTPNLPKT
tara:strand:- start:98 stop:2086 length:1989 start_codon:yes stop_codon:yes gene_type:complete